MLVAYTILSIEISYSWTQSFPVTEQRVKSFTCVFPTTRLGHVSLTSVANHSEMHRAATQIPRVRMAKAVTAGFGVSGELLSFSQSPI